MRTSQFAELWAVVPPSDYSPDGAYVPDFKRIGMAQSITVEDNFGSKNENVVGNPLPFLVPGFYQGTMSIEKATIAGDDFRSMGGMNPLWAHVGATYTQQATLSTDSITGVPTEMLGQQFFPYTFIVGAKNKVSKSFSKDNAINVYGKTEERANTFGLYLCLIQTARVSMTSSQAVMMDTVNCIARPISGTWLSETIRNALDNNGPRIEANNGDPVRSVYAALNNYLLE